MNLHIISLLVVFNVIPRTVTAPIESRHVEQSNLNITIKLNEPDNQNGQLMLYLNGSSYRLVNVSTLLPIFVHSLSNTRSSLASYFVVIGIHSLDRNITLCNYDSKKPIMNGTNLGLIWKLDNIDHLDPICMYNSAATTIKTLLMFNLYNKYHPIPGGCNIEFPIEESPFMFVHNNPSRALGPLIDYVEFQPAAIGNERSPARRCDEQIGARLNYELYAYYEQTSTIDTNTFNGDSTEHEDDYFHLISLMSNRKWLTRHSTMIYRIGSKQEHEDGSRHSQHHHRDNRHHIAVNDDSSVPSFPRLFIITSLNKRIYFNILTIINHHGKNDEEDALMWINSINMTYADQSQNIKHCSLYVPSQLNTRIFISNHIELSICLVMLSLFSLVVSIIGYRHFILELFYFAFLLTFGCYLALCSKWNSTTSSLPAISNWLLTCSIVFSLSIAALWTEICRRSKNVKLAFCGHSLTLSICLVAFFTDLIINLRILSVNMLTTLLPYYGVLLSILLCHAIFLIYLDYFWLSALSSSFTAVYFFLLPIDIYFFSGVLFRILTHLWLILSNVSNDTLVITLVVFAKSDLFLVIIFIVCIAATIYWQALTKLIAQGYGFGCMCTVPRSKISGSSIDTNAVDLQPVSYNREHVAPCSKHVMLQKTSKIRNGSSRKMKKSSINSKKTPNSTRKCNPPSSRKLYRCKHCQKYSTTRSQKRQCNGNGRLHQCQFKSKS